MFLFSQTEKKIVKSQTAQNLKCMDWLFICLFIYLFVCLFVSVVSYLKNIAFYVFQQIK